MNTSSDYIDIDDEFTFHKSQLMAFKRTEIRDKDNDNKETSAYLTFYLKDQDPINLKVPSIQRCRKLYRRIKHELGMTTENNTIA